MKIRTLVGAALTGVFLSTAAFAASMTPAQQCTALEKQFDQQITKHTTSSNFAAAKALRTDGGKLCLSGKPADGARKLKQALNDIGVKPAY
jgi:hypothetical protein